MKEKFYRFMAGRYGTDRLNNWLLYGSIAFIILSYFTSGYVMILGYILWGICIYRMFSRKIYQRYAENQKFNAMMSGFDGYKNLLKKRHNDKINAYFLCPNCKQMVRVPKGREKITITCPKCYNKFTKKS